MSRVVIVGGGIYGLAVAYRLEQLLSAAEVTVLERDGRLGGTIATVRRDGFTVECGPNGFLDSNPATRDLCVELGLADHLVAASEAARTNRYLLLDGALRLLPTGLLAFLRSDVLSPLAKLQLALERFRPGRRGGGDESVDAFARRRAGGEVARTLADAFVTGIYAGDPRLLSARAAFPRLAAYEAEHGSVQAGFAAARRQRRASGAKAGATLSLREGLHGLIDSLRAKLRTRPAVEVAVRRVSRQADGWRVEGEGADAWPADAVVLACPAHQQAAMLEGLDPQLAALVGGIPYNRVAVVALGYRRQDVPHPLDGFGYLSPQRQRRDVLGAQWCSSIFPERAPPGFVLLRALLGGWNRPEVVDWPDDRLVAAVRAENARTLRVQAAPAFVHVVRWPRAIPQYHLGHLGRVAAAERRAAAHPGLFLGGNAYHGVALNDCVEQAGRLAGRVAAWAGKAGAG